MHYITVFGLLSPHFESQRCRTTVTNMKTIQSMPSLWDTALPLTALWGPSADDNHKIIMLWNQKLVIPVDWQMVLRVFMCVGEWEKVSEIRGRRTWEPTHLSMRQRHFLSPSLATSIATLVSWPHQGHHLPLVLAQSLANGRHWQEPTQKRGERDLLELIKQVRDYQQRSLPGAHISSRQMLTNLELERQKIFF